MKLKLLAIVVIMLAFLQACSTEIEPLTQKDINSSKLSIKDSEYKNAWPDTYWWQKYRNSDLNQLIDYATENSPSIEVAKARFITAVAKIKQVNPTNKIDINALTSFEGSYLSKHGTMPPPFSGKWTRSYTIGLSASYQLDIWGQNRAMLRSATSAAKAQAAAMENATLLIATAIVQNYFVMQLDFVQLNLLEQQLLLQKQILANYKSLLQQGVIANDNVITAESNVNNLLTQIATLKNSIDLQKNILVALVGDKDKFILGLKAKPLPAINISAPKELGYTLLSRRADLQAQKWLVEASLGEVQASKAAFYPNFSLTAFAGLNSISLDNLLGLPSKQYNITPAITLPIFNSGALKAQLLVSQAKQNEAIAGYNQALVDAVKDVYTAVNNLNTINEQITLARSNFSLAKQLLNNNQDKLKQGINTDIAVLTARLNALNAQTNLTTLIFQRVITDVDLIKALGGGYKA